MTALAAADTSRRRDSIIVLAAATLTAALTGPGQTIGVSVFIDDLVIDLDLSRSEVSTAYLIGTLGGALLLPSVGRFIDRRGVRISQIVVGIAFVAALLNMSTVSGFVTLAIGFVGIRLLGQGSLSLVSVITVSLRFVQNRGIALGIFSTVSSGLMALVPLALAVTIDQVGWRDAWIVAALVVALTVVPLALLALGGMPRGEADSVSADATELIGDLDRAGALRTRGFWLLAAVGGCASMLVTALNFHQIDLLGNAGMSEAEAAVMFVPQVIGSSLAGLAVGWVSDRIGVRYLPAAGSALLIGSLLLAAVVRPGLVVVVYAVLLGATGGAIRTTLAALTPLWFGTRHLGAIQGALTFIGVATSALGPVALAVSEGALGSYPPAVLLLALLPAVATLAALADFNPRHRVRKTQ